MVPFVKKAGIAKAKRRLSEAQQLLAECKASKTHQQYLHTWPKFLASSTAVLHIIEGASRHTAQGRQWYGGKRRECRKDPLILYMYQSRNEEEHGVGAVTEVQAEMTMHVREKTTFVVPPLHGEPPHNIFELFLRPDATWRGPKPTFTFKNPTPVLLPVTSKEGDVFYPPMEHLGKPLATGGPLEVANLYLAYMAALIEEAERHS